MTAVFSVIVLYIACYSPLVQSKASGKAVSLPIFDSSNFSSTSVSSPPDTTVLTVALPSPIALGRTTEDLVHIYSNGLLSFGFEFNGSFESFPVNDEDKLITPLFQSTSSNDSAPLSATVLTDWNVKYTLASQNVSNNLLQAVNNFIVEYYQLSMAAFNAHWSLIVQWSVAGECDTHGAENKTCKQSTGLHQAVLTTDGVTSLAIFSYQCEEDSGHTSHSTNVSYIIGYSINDTLYRQYRLGNEGLNGLACANVPYSNFSSLSYQLNIGRPLLTSGPVDTIGLIAKSATFHCTVLSVTPLITVEWLRDGEAVIPSSSHVLSTITEGDVTMSSLTINLLSSSDDERSYKCRIGNTEGMMESPEAKLTVNRPVIINTPPTSITQIESSVSVTIVCVAFGVPPPSIMWVGPNGTDTSNRPGIDIQTYGSVSVLRFPTLKYTDNGEYSCIASNLPLGIDQPPFTVTKSFTVTVRAAPELALVSAREAVAILGSEIVIELRVTKAEPPVSTDGVKWTFARELVTMPPAMICHDQGIQCILDGTSLLMILKNVTTANGGIYTVQVTNSLGMATKNITLSVVDPARILTTSSQAIVTEHHPLSLTCTATGIPAPNITWSKDTVPYPLSEPEPPSTGLPYNTTIITNDTIQDSNGVYTVTSVLLVQDTLYTDRGTFVCTAANEVTMANYTSNDRVSTVIDIHTIPVLSFQPSSTIIGHLNASLNITVSITHSNPPVPPTNITWLFNNTVMITNTSKYIFTEDKQTLTILSLAFEDRGLYTVTGTNGIGHSETTAIIYIIDPVRIAPQSSNSIVITEHHPLSLTCTATGIPAPNISWSKDIVLFPLSGHELPSTGLPHNTTIITNDTLQDSNGVYTVTSVLLVQDTLYTDRGTFICTAANQDDRFSSLDSSSYPVTVQTLPVITPHLPSITALVNTSIEMGVVITRANPPVDPFSIRWTLNGNPISWSDHHRYGFSQDNRSLTIRSLEYKDEGSYRISAANAVGIVHTEITVNVVAPATVTTPQSQVVASQASNVTLICNGHGRPLPLMSWSTAASGILDSNHIVTNEMESEGVEYIQSSLTLYNVSINENGSVYICTGVNNITDDGFSISNASIQLIVQDIPDVPVAIPVLTVVGSGVVNLTKYRDSSNLDAVFTFTVTRGVPVEFTLFYSTAGNKIPLQFDSGKYSLERDTSWQQSVSLRISSVVYYDSGVYTLEARNNAGVTEASVTLNMKVESAIVSSTPSHTGGVVQYGGTAMLTCVADGVPRPSNIVWFRNTTLIDPQLFTRIEVNQTEVSGFRIPEYQGIMSVITIRNVNPAIDGGEYTCRSSNGVGQPAVLSHPLRLNITKAPSSNLCTQMQPCLNGATCVDTPSSYYCICTFDYTGQNCDKDVVTEVYPVIVDPPRNTTGGLYSTVRLHCNATGSPAPWITWYKDGSVVTTDDNSDPSVFVIHELSLSDRGFYHCTLDSRINGEGVRIESPDAVVNIKGVVQYGAYLEVRNNPNVTVLANNTESVQDLINEINEFVAGSIIEGDTSLFFIEPSSYPSNRSRNGNSGYISIVITIINSEGGSDELLQAVQKGLSDVNIGIETNLTFLVTNRHDGCQSDITTILSIPPDPSLDIQIKWPEINIGEEVFVNCPCGDGVDLGGRGFRARRYCGGSFTDGAQWADGFIAPCNFTTRVREICNIAQLPPSDRIDTIKDIIKSTMIEATELSVASSVLLTTINNTIGNTTLTKGYLGVIDNFNTVSPDVLRESVDQSNVSARLLESVETITESIELTSYEDEFTISLSTITVRVQPLRHDVEDGGTSYSDQMNSVFLPLEATELSLNSSNASTPTLVLTNYGSPSLFVRREEDPRLIVDSTVLSVSISRMNVENLTTPVVIELQPNTPDTTSRQGCYFWDTSLDDGFGNWSQEGCESNYTLDGRLTCTCSHLTNFAVLLDASAEPVKPIESIVGQALNAVSYIGVIISIICLVVTIITYTLARKLRQTEHGKLLMSLCCSLLGLYISFILAIHGTVVPAVCAVVSIMLQYFLLVTFFVMATEALNLYMKLVIVFGKGITRYFFKATMISWITPIFIVLFCFAPNYKHYIGNHFCRVSGIPFYVGILVPFLIIYLFNWTIFVIIMFHLIRKRFKTKYHESISKDQQMTFRQQFMIALTLSLLFGLGWGVGLLATQSLYTVTAVRDIFASLFILLTSFQGLFIFLMHCIKSKEVRRMWLRFAYRIAGKDTSSMMASSSMGYSRSSSTRKRSSTKKAFARSTTLKESVATVRDFEGDDDIITSHQLSKLNTSVITSHQLNELDSSSVDKTLELEEAKDYFPSSSVHTPLDISSVVNYPLPSEMSKERAFGPDFRSSVVSIHSNGSSCVPTQYYENPADPQLQKHKLNRFSTFLFSETDNSTSQACSSLPNPMLDSPSDAEPNGIIGDNN